MYNKNDLIKDIEQQGKLLGISRTYGKGSVIVMNLNPRYYLVVAESNIAPDYECFWGVTRNVIENLEKDNRDYALVLMDTQNEQVYVYDSEKAKQLLSKASYEKKSGNYRIKGSEVSNPINYNTFYEFLDTLE